MNFAEDEKIQKMLILRDWYKTLDADYHDSDVEGGGCKVCQQAITLGIKPEADEYDPTDAYDLGVESEMLYDNHIDDDQPI